MAAGKQDGRVVMYSDMVPSSRTEIAKAFQQKYGINIEFLPGRGAEMAVKLKQEHAAGLYLVDIICTAPSIMVKTIKPGGMLVPLKPLQPLSLIKYLSANDAFSMVAKAPHPNATRVFVNWWLTREAQTIHGIAGMIASTRIDFPADRLPLDLLREPGIEYFDGFSEDYYESEKGSYPLIQEIFQPLLR